MKETVLVTGAGGFVGFATVKALLVQGHPVRAFELTGSPYLKDLRALADQHGNLTVIEGDITNLRDVRRAIGDATLMVHSAALLNSIAGRDVFEAVNVQGAKNAMQAACENQIRRFLLVSTSDVFGIPDEGETITEATPYRPWQEPYADTKIKACEALREFHREQGLDFTIIYPGWVYGPGDRQFFPAIIDMLRDKHAFTWHKKTPYAVDFIYIDDLVSAITNALFNPAARNEDFLILDENSSFTPEMIYRWMANYLNLDVSIHKLPYSLMMTIARASQWLTRKGITKKHLLSSTDVKAFGNDFRFSSAKARERLAWEPRIKETEGFERYFRWAGIHPGAVNLQSGHNESC